MRIPVVFIVPVAAAAMLSGCGNSSNTATKSSSPSTSATSSPAAPVVDIAGIETRIANSLTKPGAGGGAPNAANPTVKCPSKVTARASETFTCDVTAEEGPTGPVPGALMTGTAEVTLQDDTGKEIQLHIKLATDGYSIETHGPG